jgi:uncharacterized protein YndB with AHSA1/START domain
MNDLPSPSAYGTPIEPAPLRIERMLPGPIERVWDYLTKSELRRQWLAAGEMEMKVGAPFELVWRNDELSAQPSQRPDGFGEEHRLQSRILALDPPHRLVIAFGDAGEVAFDLATRGGKVLLSVTHSRLPDRETMLMVGAGWHAHLDVMVARLGGAEPGPFWDAWRALKDDYDRRLPA